MDGKEKLVKNIKIFNDTTVSLARKKASSVTFSKNIEAKGTQGNSGVKKVLAPLKNPSKWPIVCYARIKYNLRHTANEGLVRIQYKCLVPIYVFPDMNGAASLFLKQNYNDLSPDSYTHISVRDIYFSWTGLSIFLSQICGMILEIYKSLTDTIMWKLEAMQFPEKEYINGIFVAVQD